MARAVALVRGAETRAHVVDERDALGAQLAGEPACAFERRAQIRHHRRRVAREPDRGRVRRADLLRFGMRVDEPRAGRKPRLALARERKERACADQQHEVDALEQRALLAVLPGVARVAHGIRQARKLRALDREDRDLERVGERARPVAVLLGIGAEHQNRSPCRAQQRDRVGDRHSVGPARQPRLR